MTRGALAGATAAAAWAAAEPSARKLFGTEYGDVRLLGRFFTRGPVSLPLGLGLHLVSGAVFGALFERLGGRGWKQAVVAAQLENLVLWPGMAVIDRAHPDRRSGALPPLLTNGRVLAQEVAVHALFGLVLGLLVVDRAPQT
jgi:hypothetical protein